MSISKNLKQATQGLVLASALTLSATTVNAAQNGEAENSGWTGFYVGGYIGAGGVVNKLSVPAFGGFSFDGIGGEGILGGGMVGFNYQVSSDFVVGLQGDIGSSNLETELNIPGLISLSARPKFTASISARAGWLASQNTLLYVLGGYSYAKYGVKLSAPGGGQVALLPPLSLSVKENYEGFNVGAGIETKITPSLTARVEYRYTRYGSEDWGLGFLNVRPVTHTATLGIAWQLYNIVSGEVVTPVADLDPPVAQSNWTGPYVGAWLGAGAVVNNIEFPGIAPGNFNGIGGQGLLGGGMVGYNFQVAPEFVVGIQGDIGYSDLETTLSIGGLNLFSAKPQFMASVSGRAGWLPSPDTMMYVLGGFSHTKYKASIPIVGLSVKESYYGFHVGGGIETKLSEEISARIEYRYTQYSGKDWGTGGFLNIEPSAHTATIGVAWNFGNLM